MSEWLTGLLLAAAEFGLLVSLVFGVYLYLQSRGRRHDKARVRELVARLKSGAADHESSLITALVESYGLPEAAAGDRAQSLIDQEKSLYRKVMRLFLGRDRTGINRFDEDVRTLLMAYRNLIEAPPEVEGAEDSSSPSVLRRENRRLRERNAKLEADLATAMATMENMLTEYASMYEGGRKEGKQRMKNEMFRLRQTLGTNTPAQDDDGIPERKDIADQNPE